MAMVNLKILDFQIMLVEKHSSVRVPPDLEAIIIIGLQVSIKNIVCVSDVISMTISVF